MILEVLPRHVPRQIANVNGGAGASGTAPAALATDCDSANIGASIAVLAHEDQAAVQLGVVQRADRRGRVARVGECDKAAPLGAGRARLHHHVGMQNLTNGLEMILEVLPRHVPRQIAHVHRLATLRLSAATALARALGCGIGRWPANGAGTGSDFSWTTALSRPGRSPLHELVKGHVQRGHRD